MQIDRTRIKYTYSIYLKTRPNILVSSNPEDDPSILIANPNSFSRDLFTFSEFKKTQNLKLPNPLLPFYIGFTSGTTGVAKGFVRSQTSWIESFKSLSQDIKVNTEKGVITLGSFFLVKMALQSGKEIN